MGSWPALWRMLRIRCVQVRGQELLVLPGVQQVQESGRLCHLGEDVRGRTPTEPSLCAALREGGPFGWRGGLRLPEQVPEALRSNLCEGGKFGHALSCCCRCVSQGHVRCVELPEAQRAVCRRGELVEIESPAGLQREDEPEGGHKLAKWRFDKWR